MMKLRRFWMIAGFSSLALLGVETQAIAQSNDVSQMSGRINQIENQIQTLSRAVFRGDADAAAALQTASSSATPTAGNARAVADLNIRLGQLESQIQQLTGKLEEQNHKINQLSSRVAVQNTTASVAPQNTRADDIARPLNTDLPGAGFNLNPVTSPVISADSTPVTSPAVAAPEDSVGADSLYEQSFVKVRDGQYTEADAGFSKFLSLYPNHNLTPNAQYWLAETHYVRGKYNEAARLFAKGYQDYPKSPKAPDNLLKLGLSLSKLGNTEDACLSFLELKNEFPNDVGPIMRRASEESQTLNCG